MRVAPFLRAHWPRNWRNPMKQHRPSRNASALDHPRSFQDQTSLERDVLRALRRKFSSGCSVETGRLRFRTDLHFRALRMWADLWGQDREFFRFFIPACHHVVYHDGCSDLAYLERCARTRHYPHCQPETISFEVPLGPDATIEPFVPPCTCRYSLHVVPL